MVALDFISQENTVVLVSRTVRQLQHYRNGCRLVLGCILYIYKFGEEACLKDSEELELEVLVINSQEGNGMLFPKGGWELDESKKEAALRETIEELGKLGKWSFNSKTHDSFYEGCMFPLLVQEQLDFWSEQNVRQRISTCYESLQLIISVINI